MDTFDNIGEVDDVTPPERLLAVQAFLHQQAEWWDADNAIPHMEKRASGLILHLDSVRAALQVCGDEVAVQVGSEFLLQLGARMRESDLLTRIDTSTLLLFLKHCSNSDAIRVAEDLHALARRFRHERHQWSIAGRIDTRVEAFSGADTVQRCVQTAGSAIPGISEAQLAALVEMRDPQRADVLTFAPHRQRPVSRSDGPAEVVSLATARRGADDLRVLPAGLPGAPSTNCFWLSRDALGGRVASGTASDDSPELALLQRLAATLQPVMRTGTQAAAPTLLLEWRGQPPDLHSLGELDALMATRDWPVRLCLMLRSDRVWPDVHRWLPFLSRWQRRGGEVGVIASSDVETVARLVALTCARCLCLAPDAETPEHRRWQRSGIDRVFGSAVGRPVWLRALLQGRAGISPSD